MDGLVSTGNKFPDTILVIIFSNKKNFSNYFIHIFHIAVDNDEVVVAIATNFFH